MVRVRPKSICSSFSLLFSHNLWNLLYTSELLHIATCFTNCSKSSVAQLESGWAKALRTYLCFQFFSKAVKWMKIGPVPNQHYQVTQVFLPVCKLCSLFHSWNSFCAFWPSTYHSRNQCWAVKRFIFFTAIWFLCSTKHRLGLFPSWEILQKLFPSEGLEKAICLFGTLQNPHYNFKKYPGSETLLSLLSPTFTSRWRYVTWMRCVSTHTASLCRKGRLTRSNSLKKCK